MRFFSGLAIGLIFACATSFAADARDGFVLMSSRASYELVHKTAMAGVGLLACMSAPSSLAISTAQGLGLQLWAFVREGRATRYA